MIKSDKCMGVSQLLGGMTHMAGLPPKSTPMSEIFLYSYQDVYDSYLTVWRVSFR